MFLFVRLASVALLTFTAAFAFAQDVPAYATKIDAIAAPGSVKLTWKDAEGYVGAKYEIWRSEKDIAKDSLVNAKLIGTVATGVMAFEDTTVTALSFYLVLLKDADGTRRSYFIPGRNKTSAAVAPLEVNIKGTAVISSVATSISGKSIVVQFRALPTDRKLNVYRTTVPVKVLADLKDAVVLGQTTGSKAPWVDSPPAGKDYYYTILDSAAQASAAADVFSASNTTALASGFPLVAVSEGTKEAQLSQALRPVLEAGYRPLPLPMLQVLTDPSTGAAIALPPTSPELPPVLSAATEKILATWSKGLKIQAASLPGPTVLPEDALTSQTGDAKLLSQIVQTYFSQKDWSSSETQLSLLLQRNLTQNIASRTHFYRGQAFAFQKLYRPAFLEFLLARDDYLAASDAFLNGLFTLLKTMPE